MYWRDEASAARRLTHSRPSVSPPHRCIEAVKAHQSAPEELELLSLLLSTYPVALEKDKSQARKSAGGVLRHKMIADLESRYALVETVIDDLVRCVETRSVLARLSESAPAVWLPTRCRLSLRATRYLV